MIRTLTFQDSILGRQLGYLNDSAKAIMKRTRFQNSRLQNERFLSTQERISGVYAFADSVDRGLLSFFAAANTSIDKEYSKKRMITAYFESDSVLSRLQASLFSLAGFLQTADSALGKQFAQQLPASLQIVSRTKKAYSWQRYFILEKPASVAYMHLKRIKLLMLQTGIQLAERRIAASQKNYRSISLSIPPPAPVTPNLATDPKELKIDSLSRSAASIPEQLRNEILNTIRLDRYYVGIPTVLLAATEKLNLKDVEIILLPEARLINTSDRVQVLFSAPGQYQLSVYYKNAASRPLVLQRKINADRLPDPLVRVNLEGNTRNVIRSEDLSRVNRLVATIPVVGLPNVMLRVNGFRGTIVGEGGEKSSVYNYGQVFQESMRELLNSLQQGDLLLLDNITVAVGDGSTRSASPILYKIVN